MDKRTVGPENDLLFPHSDRRNSDRWSAKRSSLLAIVLTLGLSPPGCAEPQASARADSRPKATASFAAMAPSAMQPAARRVHAGSFIGADRSEEELLSTIGHGAPNSFRPVGTTSTVFKMSLAGPVAAAFKAATVDRPYGPTAEVAAYRLARCLGLDTVPPAVSRAIPLSRIHALLAPRAREQWEEINGRLGVPEEGLVSGAAIYWIPELVDIGMDTRTGLKRAGEWLSGRGEISDSQRSLAASISSMLAFDYLTGNRDRWSGANVAGNATATTVYVRDNDMAFPSQLPEHVERRLFADTRVAERFSRALYERLQGLTRERFEDELRRDPLGAQRPLLSEQQLRGVFSRRQTLLAHIDSLIAERGRDAVLVFD